MLTMKQHTVLHVQKEADTTYLYTQLLLKYTD